MSLNPGVAVETLERRRMSYDDYLALPEHVRAEWVDGEVVVTPSASYRHQRISHRLATLLDDGLPGLFVVEAVTVFLPGNRERIPDLSVLDHEPEGAHIHAAPMLVVEILSPSTRSEDTVRKSGDYLAAGIGQYWIVDPDNRCIDVFDNTETGWELLARVDEAAPVAHVQVTADLGLELRLSAVLPE